MSQILFNWICVHKAAMSWHHAAHHVTKGKSFSGDHGLLFGRIYTEYQTDFDGIVEKVIGITNDEEAACPNRILEGASELLEAYRSPSNCDALTIATTALELTKDYINYLEQMFDALEDGGNLSLGLNDMIAAHANRYETHIYLLQQRIKEHIGSIK